MKDFRPYAQLVRLPAVPTALADICLGALATGAPSWGTAAWLPFLLLLGASACLYAGGMVWNDYFDREQDRRERPFRPLPSGRVTPGQAARFGAALLAVGLALAILAGVVEGLSGRALSPSTPPIVAVLLVAAILLYDARLKRTWAGPISMGACRFLNVLLGLSVAGSLDWPRGAYLALVVGTYVAGVTWFARTEARTSSQAALQGAAAVMLAALVLALPVPVLRPEEGPAHLGRSLFPYLLVALGFLVGLPVCRAIARPVPAQVQTAVRTALLGLVLLDAILATALAGLVGLLLLVLLVPSLYLARTRWLYAT
jgi:hypothetical protein